MNWKAMRETQKKLIEENEALKAQMSQLSRQVAPTPQQQGPDPDELVDYKTAQMLMAQMQNQTRVQYAELALKQQFPDLEQVLLDKDLQSKAAQADPELWESLQYQPDPYKRGVGLYKVMKRHQVDSKEAESARAQAQANLSKPVPGPYVTQRTSPTAPGVSGTTKLSKDQAKNNLANALRGWTR